MKLVLWMTLASALSWVVATAVVGRQAGVEILLGLLGPLLVVSATWMAVEWTYRTRPDRLTSLMIASFAGKLVFFGAYIATMLALLSPRPVPFVISFTSSFIALYFVEALSLRHLFSGAPRVSR